MSIAPDMRCLAGVPLSTAQERFLAALFESLWQRYYQRVEYVRAYAQIVRQAGASFVNDHLAFRTLASQAPLSGIVSISRIFEALGYRAAAAYQFDDKHLSALHFQHPHPDFPKLFISELRLWELPRDERNILLRSAREHRAPLDDEVLAALANLDHNDRKANGDVDKAILEIVVDWIQRLPWPPPEKSGLLTVNRLSQYAAWVLVHGYNVNHFTALVNSHGVASLNDLEKTIAALRAAGVPMKAEIEGEPGSPLRQSATAAASTLVDVVDEGRTQPLAWTYAYFELAQRDWMLDPKTAQRTRFEGFLGPQATQLFDMTKTRAAP